MPRSASLQQHFDYWDDFVRAWRSGSYPRALHMPEPWWGWTPEEGLLHSVALNLSPAPGGKLQTRPCVACAMACIGSYSYSAAMLSGALRSHLAPTERWHYSRRYLPLMKAIAADDADIAPDTRHHLSIELAPFHDSLSNARFCELNPDHLVAHVLKFAADASIHIAAPWPDKSPSPLKSIVMVRAAVSKIRAFAADCITERKITVNPPGETPLDVDTFRLVDPELKDVIFVCMSGARNYLPKTEYISQAIININNLKLEE
ncbi:MAG: hypothetical protein HDS78_04060 [Bacteroidales bacterium]|nr:hypothetical protein [Bacteroidales bacterium]